MFLDRALGVFASSRSDPQNLKVPMMVSSTIELAAGGMESYLKNGGRLDQYFPASEKMEHLMVGSLPNRRTVFEIEVGY